MRAPMDPIDPRARSDWPYGSETKLELQTLTLLGSGVPAHVWLVGFAHRFPCWGYARDDDDFEHIFPDRFWGYTVPPRDAVPLSSPLPLSLQGASAEGLRIFQIPLDRYGPPPTPARVEVLTQDDTYTLVRPMTKANFEDAVLAVLRMHSHRLGRRVDWEPHLVRIEAAVCGERLRMRCDPRSVELLLRANSEETLLGGPLLGGLGWWLRAERIAVKGAPPLAGASE